MIYASSPLGGGFLNETEIDKHRWLELTMGKNTKKIIIQLLDLDFKRTKFQAHIRALSI